MVLLCITGHLRRGDPQGTMRSEFYKRQIGTIAVVKHNVGCKKVSYCLGSKVNLTTAKDPCLLRIL